MYLQKVATVEEVEPVVTVQALLLQVVVVVQVLLLELLVVVLQHPQPQGLMWLILISSP
jgi:hypothetical protein